MTRRWDPSRGAQIHSLQLGPGPPGRLRAPSVLHSKLVSYGVFVLASRAPNGPKRRFLARAGRAPPARAAAPCAGRPPGLLDVQHGMGEGAFIALPMDTLYLIQIRLLWRPFIALPMASTAVETRFLCPVQDSSTVVSAKYSWALFSLRFASGSWALFSLRFASDRTRWRTRPSSQRPARTPRAG